MSISLHAEGGARFVPQETGLHRSGIALVLFRELYESPAALDIGDAEIAPLLPGQIREPEPGWRRTDGVRVLRICGKNERFSIDPDISGC